MNDITDKVLSSKISEKTLKDIRIMEDCVTVWKEKLITFEETSTIDTGPKSCPACLEYLNHECDGCPIKEYTNEEYCRSTPHEELCELKRELIQNYTYINKTEYPVTFYEGWFSDKIVVSRKILVAIQEEIDFLEKILGNLNNHVVAKIHQNI